MNVSTEADEAFMESLIQEEIKERVAMSPTDIKRWASGQANHDTFLDASDGFGRCRWCGGKMSAHYPKDGRALNYRCCSLFCQILYGAGIGRFELPLKSNGEINFAEGRRQLSALEDVSIKSNLIPTWCEKTGTATASVRICANSTSGRHSLPHDARNGQLYCGPACRMAAHRAKNRIA